MSFRKVYMLWNSGFNQVNEVYSVFSEGDLSVLEMLLCNLLHYLLFFFLQSTKIKSPCSQSKFLKKHELKSKEANVVPS